MNAYEPTPPTEILRVDDLEIDTLARSVSRHGSVLDLPELSYRLFLTLVRHAPQRVSKDQLIEEVWQGTIVSDETLSQRIRLLRRVLGEDSQQPRYIASIRNQGYRLIAPVTEPRAEAPERPSQVIRNFVLVPGALLLIGAAILLTARFVTQIEPDPDPDPGGLRTLAVLPFADLSPEGDHGYFSDGIHEELLSRLSQVENFSVVSRTSVLPFRSTQQSVPEIALQLGVSSILEGSVRLMANRVRITTQLIDGESDRHLWSQTFERELTMHNLFAIQEEVASAIAVALETKLSGTDRSRLVKLPTSSLEAYNLYLLGRYHVFEQTADDLSQAVNFLQRSLVIDDQFAKAWASLGWAFSFQSTGYGTQSPHEAYPRAREAALRALALNGELADAHSLYADILTWYDWDWVAAEREYLATLELDPFNGLGYALFLSTQLRHDEAIELIDRLLNRFPGSEYYHINAAWRFLNARDYPRAIQHAELAGGHADARNVAGWALLSTGRIEDALALFEQDFADAPDRAIAVSNLAVAHIRAGDTVRGNELLGSLLAMANKHYVDPTVIAVIHFEQNNPDKGFAWLQTAAESRARGLIFLQVDHGYDGHRSDPRYQKLIADLGFGGS